MFPQYPPFSNRIYVNPKFNKGTVGASQHMQLQQQQQQQQFMEMEAQRMLLMQRQMQLLQQEQKRLAELDQKRREATEIMRQKQLQKNAEVKMLLKSTLLCPLLTVRHQSGEKRPRPVDSNYDRAAKRQERFAPSPTGGITIKGVAAARNNSLPPENISYQPPNERRVSSPYERKSTASFDRKPYEKPSITSRLGNTANSAVSKASIAPNKNSSALITATPVLPIVTNGKSNILIIKGLGKDTKEQDIRSMTNEINGGVHEIKLDSNTNSATVSFSSVESAVTFRRKYNRFQMGESHINISFQK
ncbi:hypothetical protein [Parasitella parasitica]|uniref:RRM domain-containing protein n=1 Tax=Parasitella parasitica TaxID=35722 RepID=A0A0B7MPR7_9FUNG|nr:hypothetical protein [Parasitella parasitica]